MPQEEQTSCPEWSYSDHALVRLQQRGVRSAACAILERFGEILEWQSHGRTMIGLSQEVRTELVEAGMPPQLVDAAADKRLVVARDGCVVTCLNAPRRGRRSTRRRKHRPRRTRRTLAR